jgi:hypothetical protein
MKVSQTQCRSDPQREDRENGNEGRNVTDHNKDLSKPWPAHQETGHNCLLEKSLAEMSRSWCPQHAQTLTPELPGKGETWAPRLLWKLLKVLTGGTRSPCSWTASSFLKGDLNHALLHLLHCLHLLPMGTVINQKARPPQVLNATLFLAWNDQMNTTPWTVGDMQLNILWLTDISCGTTDNVVLSAFFYIPNFRSWPFIFFLIGNKANEYFKISLHIHTFWSTMTFFNLLSQVRD